MLAPFVHGSRIPKYFGIFIYLLVVELINREDGQRGSPLRSGCFPGKYLIFGVGPACRSISKALGRGLGASNQPNMATVTSLPRSVGSLCIVPAPDPSRSGRGRRYRFRVDVRRRRWRPKIGRDGRRKASPGKVAEDRIQKMAVTNALLKRNGDCNFASKNFWTPRFWQLKPRKESPMN